MKWGISLTPALLSFYRHQPKTKMGKSNVTLPQGQGVSEPAPILGAVVQCVHSTDRETEAWEWGRITQLPSSKERHEQELKFTFVDSTFFRIKV